MTTDQNAQATFEHRETNQNYSKLGVMIYEAEENKMSEFPEQLQKLYDNLEELKKWNELQLVKIENMLASQSEFTERAKRILKGA